MGFSIAALNNIRANASEEYKNRIPEASQATLLSIGQAFSTYTPLYNEFCEALINKIGKTIIESQLFHNKLAAFKSGTIYTGQDVEEIFVEMAKAEGQYNPEGPNPLGRRTGPDVHVVYHRKNRADYYAISLGDLDFLRVFRSEATLDAFISSRLQAVYNGAEKDEWLYMKNLLATYDGYFDYEVPVIGGDNAEKTARTFLKTLRKASLDLSFLSTQFNKAGVERKCEPGSTVLLIHKDVLAETDVEVLSKAMNLGKTDIQVEVVSMDDFGEMGDTYGLLVEKDWFRVWDTLSHMEPQRNAQGLFTNHFYHVHQILSASPFKNAVRFKAVQA